ncbi:MAG: RNA 2',3'-cyclic phosphodiesterase [Nitrospirae bacterium]|nr:RNA 2',3'-cyclic phosphodiesterase [Nitrospirota bacterium]
MHRLFVAIDFPKTARERLSMLCHGLPDARWIDPAQMHLTVRFIGEVEGSVMLDVREALATVVMTPFELMLMGVGHFPPRGKPTTLWTGADGGDALHTLFARVSRALEGAGIAPEGRKYMPHVTLARLSGTPPTRVAGYMQHHAAFTVPPFPVTAFHLYESTLTAKGALHRKAASYPLHAG